MAEFLINFPGKEEGRRREEKASCKRAISNQPVLDNLFFPKVFHLAVATLEIVVLQMNKQMLVHLISYAIQIKKYFLQFDAYYVLPHGWLVSFMVNFYCCLVLPSFA